MRGYWRAALLLCLLTLLPLPCRGEEPLIPTYEELHYVITWEGIKVGEAMISCQRWSGGYNLEMKVWSTGVVDKIYRVRDVFRATLDLGLNHFMYYEKMVREGRYHRHDLLKYRPEVCRLEYRKNRKPPRYREWCPPLFDPFSVLFRYRWGPEWGGVAPVIPVTDGKHLERLVVRRIGEERLRLSIGEFDTLRVSPRWKRIRGVFKRKKNGRVWVWFSNDARRLPLQIEAELFLGSIKGRLVKVVRKP